MLRPTWRTLKPQRTELTIIAVGLVVWAVAVAVLTLRLNALDTEFPGCFGLLVVGADCDAGQSVFALWDQTAEFVQLLGLVIPIALGVLIGVPVVAREVETGVAQVTWSLATSRLRWFALQIVPLLAVLVVLLAVVAIGGEWLTVARLGGDDPGFFHHDQRGALVIVRGLLAFAVGLFVGTLTGRVLPGLLLAVALTAILVGGLSFGLDRWRAQEADVVRIESIGPDSPYVNGMMLGQVAVLPDGSVTRDLSSETILSDADLDWMLSIPASKFSLWIARESAITLAIGAALAAATALALRHRRPR
jgi:hypothetical protein